MKEQTVKKRTGYLFAKRCFDIFCSLLAIILLSPIFLILMAIVKLTSEGPVFYSHKRIGKYGKEIGILKFRSMFANAEEMKKNFTPEQKKEYEENFKLENDPRVTKVGKFLRKSSLDELPQLFNILIGTISIVGPRPITYEETLKYGEDRDLLLSVKPGLTGLWAANGRSDVSYDERIRLELQYVRECSFWFDIKIIFQTVFAVLKGKGAK